MSTQRDRYNAVVAEVESDLDKVEIFLNEDNNIEADGFGAGKRIVAEVVLNSDTDVFADFAIRDALIMNSLENEDFAMVLCNKIVHTLHDKVEVQGIAPKQSDLEALTLACNVSLMWEQIDAATGLATLIPNIAEQYDLEQPSLLGLTQRLIMASHTFDIAGLRESSVASIKDDVMASLD